MRRGARALAAVMTLLVALESALPLLALLGGLTLLVGQFAETFSDGACNRLVANVGLLIGLIYLGIIGKLFGWLLGVAVALALIAAALRRLRRLTAWGLKVALWGLGLQLLVLVVLCIALREAPHTLLYRYFTGSEVLGGVTDPPGLSELL